MSLESSCSVFSWCPQPEEEESEEPDNQPPEKKNGSESEKSPEVIDPNILLPALKSFLEQVSKSRWVTWRRRALIRSIL